MNATERYDSLIEYFAGKYQLPFTNVKKQVFKESSCDPYRVNKVTGASGLMQLMPDTMKWIATKGVRIKDAFHPEQNLDAGCWYMAFLLARMGLRFEENHYPRVPFDDLYRMALTGYLGGAAYVYVALRELDKADRDLIWPNVRKQLETASFEGKRISVKDVDDYIAAILPWRGGVPA